MTDRDYDVTQILNTKISDVSESLHKLADQFDQDNTSRDIAWLNATNVELQRIGWNSLFVSSTIHKCVEAIASNTAPFEDKDQTTIFRQIDGLHMAVKYLSQSVRSLKAGQWDQSGQKEAIVGALDQLADRLMEATNECRCS